MFEQILGIILERQTIQLLNARILIRDLKCWLDVAEGRLHKLEYR